MTRPLLLLSLLGLAALLFPACSLLGDDGAPLDGEVHVVVADGEITLTNGSAERVYYAAFARNVLPYIEWARHVDDRGPSLAPGQRAALTAGDIWQFSEAGPEVVVFWWRAEVREGERVPTEPEAAVVEL